MPAYAAIKRLLESLAHHPPAEEEHPDDADGGSYHCQAPDQPVSPWPLFSARWKARCARVGAGRRAVSVLSSPGAPLKSGRKRARCFALRVASCGGGGTRMQTCKHVLVPCLAICLFDLSDVKLGILANNLYEI